MSDDLIAAARQALTHGWGAQAIQRAQALAILDIAESLRVLTNRTNDEVNR
jgi:hypothetical protein